MCLRHCYIDPSTLVNWKSLTSLDIADTLLSNDILHNIFKGSLSLKYLEVRNCWGLFAFDVTCNTSLKTLVIDGISCEGDAPSILDIDAPCVESLILMGSFESTKCRVLNVSSSLKEAELTFDLSETSDDTDGHYIELQVMLTELLQSLAHASTLTVGNWCLKVLSLKVAKTLSFPSLSSKCLILESLLRKLDHPGIITLLESSPRLETLRFDSSDDIPHDKVDFHPPIAFYDHCSEDFCWMS